MPLSEGILRTKGFYKLPGLPKGVKYKQISNKHNLYENLRAEQRKDAKRDVATRLLRLLFPDLQTDVSNTGLL